METSTLISRTRSYIFVVAVVCLSGLANVTHAQQGYELQPAPDLWYNDVDGIRAGVRILGQVPGTFGDGPHRLDMGVWLGTWIPDNPVSYYLSFTEPIPSISGFNSEGSLQLVSSIRTGFHQHGLLFNKRWQAGFNENNFKKLTVGLRAENRFEDEYVPFPQLWQDEWLYLAGVDLYIQDEHSLGRYTARTTHSVNFAGNASSFLNSTAELEQLIVFSQYFALRTRIFGGISTNDTAPEYLFSHSFKSPVRWMENGLTRAKGTIPTPWMEQGIIQVAGGPNLRGYLGQDMDALDAGFSPVFTSMGAINIEFDYPNPLGRAIQKIPVIGGLMNLRSYLFLDSGTSPGITDLEEDRWLSDAGLGFMLSLNIPDYLGNPRGIMIRYDIPLWLSDPADENHFEFRNLIGIGAVIAL